MLKKTKEQEVVSYNGKKKKKRKNRGRKEKERNV